MTPTAVHHRYSGQADASTTRPRSDGVREFLLGDDLLLFRESTGTLLRANPMAALIWKAIDAGLDWAELTALLVDTFALPEDRVARDLAALADQWRDNGLLAAENRPPGDRGPLRQDVAPRWSPPWPVPSAGPECIETRYRLLDNHIHLCLPDRPTADRIHPMLTHLATSGAASVDVRLEVRRANGYFLLLCDGDPVDGCQDLRGVAPMVHAQLHLLTYERGVHFFGLHAAAVAYRDNCLLMPAVCGSGKSTLTAALVACGFTYCSDDMAFLTPPPVVLRSAPLAMGIKSGSWAVLAAHFPELSSLDCHERADGKRIRYLPPPAGEPILRPERTMAVTHIVFPRFGDGETALLSPLSPADGLCRITQAGYAVNGERLTAASLEQLVSWIAEVPCYEFCYGDLGEAVDLLKGLVA